MTQKKRIVIIVGVGALLITAVEMGIHRLNRDMDQLVTDVVAAAPKAGDMFKGALGRRLLEHGTIQGFRLDPGDCQLSAPKWFRSRHLQNFSVGHR